MAVVLAKLLSAPACVVAVSLAGRRWGVAVAGVLGGLPVVAGPILVVLTLVHGRAFGARAAAGTLLGLAALTLFVVVYGKTAERRGPSLSGLLAPFPIITSVLAVFTHLHGGSGQVRVLLRSFLVGFYGFAAFCFVLAAGLDSLSGPAAFGAALVAAVAVQSTVVMLRTRRLRPLRVER